MADASKNQVIVLAVVEGGLSVSEAARRFGVSRQWVHRLLARHRLGGIEAVSPRSRKARGHPRRTDDTTRALIVQWRSTLLAEGLDAGADSIQDRLVRSGNVAPSRSTIWRILRAHDMITHQPQKRPRSSWTRFEAAVPNETWQSDMTHWRLADGTGVEIITWLDDHSRFITHISAHRVVTAPLVTETFRAAATTHGLPASTLTDNGLIYTTRFAAGKGGPNHFEHVIKELGITQKNGHPGHPQTQGKIERFHQTLKRWLSTNGPRATLEELNEQLGRFTHTYNTQRPHRALHRRTPAEAYAALPKAEPTIDVAGTHYRIRFDTIDTSGVITLRWAGKLRHLGIGRAHRQRPVMALINGPHTIIVDRETSEILAEHTINPDRDYQPKKH